jgi:hypothetical protein
MADRGHSTRTKPGVGTLAFNSALAIYNSWGDAGSVVFVLAAHVALWLLFLCLRQFKQGQGQGAGIPRSGGWQRATISDTR